MSVASQVVEQWRAQGVKMDGPAVDEATLQAIERAHGVRLPDSFRELWSLCDGTCTTDRHFLVFLQASDLREADHGHREGDLFTLMFADHRLGTAVCLGLGPASEERGVWLIDATRVQVAADFEGFLERLLLPEPFSRDG